ncbi:Uncharacterised protein [BD1-7 clade bacterium]|uniref:Uncharacterized protein n=1 Tax=BD1-7 clade bacterium TaxID=2029982 RepID=A0A5S9QZ26_9GAMM|nr:Uncharacterised protein [BD1-7 clade bacterium]
MSLAIVSVISGCAWQPANTEYTKLSDNTYESKSEEHKIKIYRSTLPEKKYEELGVAIADGGGVASFGGSMGDSYENAIKLLKEEARKQGGDAVIDIREGSAGGSAFVTLTGTIVRWK